MCGRNSALLGDFTERCLPGEPLKLLMNLFLLASPTKNNRCKKTFPAPWKTDSSCRNKAASVPSPLAGSRGEDIYMENEEQRAV